MKVKPINGIEERDLTKKQSRFSIEIDSLFHYQFIKVYPDTSLVVVIRYFFKELYRIILMDSYLK